MNAKAKSFLRGAGSVLDLAPARSLRKMAPHRTAAERMASHFAHVGESVSRACGTFTDDGQTPATKAKTA